MHSNTSTIFSHNTFISSSSSTSHLPQQLPSSLSHGRTHYDLIEDDQGKSVYLVRGRPNPWRGNGPIINRQPSRTMMTGGGQQRVDHSSHENKVISGSVLDPNALLFAWRVRRDSETGKFFFSNCAGLSKKWRLPDYFELSFQEEMKEFLIKNPSFGAIGLGEGGRVEIAAGGQEGTLTTASSANEARRTSSSNQRLNNALQQKQQEENERPSISVSQQPKMHQTRELTRNPRMSSSISSSASSSCVLEAPHHAAPPSTTTLTLLQVQGRNGKDTPLFEKEYSNNDKGIGGRTLSGSSLRGQSVAPVVSVTPSASSSSLSSLAVGLSTRMSTTATTTTTTTTTRSEQREAAERERKLAEELLLKQLEEEEKDKEDDDKAKYWRKKKKDAEDEGLMLREKAEGENGAQGQRNEAAMGTNAQDGGRNNTNNAEAVEALTNVIQSLKGLLENEREQRKDLEERLKKKESELVDRAAAEADAEEDDIRLKLKILDAIAIRRREDARFMRDDLVSRSHRELVANDAHRERGRAALTEYARIAPPRQSDETNRVGHATAANRTNTIEKKRNRRSTVQEHSDADFYY